MIYAYSVPALSVAAEKFKEIIVNNEEQGKRTVVFCEDRLALVAENLVCSAVGGSFLTSVYSFGRFLSLEKSADTVQVLSNQGSAMIIRKLINENRAKLKLFKRLSSAKSAQGVYDTIALLYSSRISARDLSEYEVDNALLSDKIADLALLYGEYSKYLQENGLMDRNTYLRQLPEVIEKSAKIVNADVIFFGFQAFTCSVSECVRACMYAAKNVHGIFVGGDSDVYTNESLTAFCGQANYFGGAKICRFCKNLSAEASAFLESVYNPVAFSSAKKVCTDKINVFKALNREEETLFAAAQIKKCVLSENKRYRDITVMVPDVKTYADVIERVFSEYDIPFYLDVKYNLSESLIADFVLKYFECLVDGCLPASVFCVVSSPLFGADEGDKNAFINYILQYANYRGGVKKNVNDDVAKVVDAPAIERVRKAFLSGLSFLPTKASGCEYRRAVEKLTEYFNCKTVVESLANEFSDAYPVQSQFIRQSFSRFNAVILEAEKLTFSDEMSVKEFNQILQSGLVATQISIIPPKSDAVFIGDLNATASVGTDVEFVFGLTADVPSCSMDTSILTDRELISLEKLNVVISPKIAQVNMRLREMTALNISSFREKLFLSYPVSVDGEDAGTSEIIKYVYSLFKRNSSANIVPLTYKQMLKDPSAVAYVCCKPNPAIRRLLASNDYSGAWSAVYRVLKEEGYADKVDYALGFDEGKKPIVGGYELFVRNGHVSPTAIESYFTCPYKSFMQRGLGVKKRKEGNFDAIDSGNYVHSVMQRMGEYLMQECANVMRNGKKNKFDEEFRMQYISEARKCASSLINEMPYKTLLDTNSGRYSAEQLVAGAVSASMGLYKHIDCSGFSITDVEAIKYMPLIDGIDLKCKIDRVDTCEDMVRVIDYKSSVKQYDSTRYYTGVQLQPELYLLSASNGKRPVGAYYFGAVTDYTKDGNLDFCMNGVMDNGSDVLLSSDYSLESGKKSAFVGARLGAKSSNSNLSSSDFADLLQYSLMVSAQGVSEIAAGNIAPAPTAKACESCEFGGCCDYCTGVDTDVREEKKVNSEQIINVVRAKGGKR